MSEHRIEFPGKTELAASSGTALERNKSLVSPEELFVAALSSCQMLTYLHLCARNSMIVTEYRDEAHADLALKKEGPHRVQRVLLRPRITFEEAESEEFRAMAIRLIHEAHDECYLANSVKCRVDIEPLLIWT